MEYTVVVSPMKDMGTQVQNSLWFHRRLNGATAARLTPDQKVGSSNLSWVIGAIGPCCLLFLLVAIRG